MLALACTLIQRGESALVREHFFYHKRRTITEETSVERKKIAACTTDLRMFF
jgi:hypothetical protein